jgi:hypothetical protein
MCIRDRFCIEDTPYLESFLVLIKKQTIIM